MIHIYTKQNCSYCADSKKFMTEHKLPFKEFKLDLDFTREYIKEKFPTATTYPIILYEGVYVGGFVDLKKLYENGELNVS